MRVRRRPGPDVGKALKARRRERSTGTLYEASSALDARLLTTRRRQGGRTGSGRSPSRCCRRRCRRSGRSHGVHRDSHAERRASSGAANGYEGHLLLAAKVWHAASPACDAAARGRRRVSAKLHRHASMGTWRSSSGLPWRHRPTRRPCRTGGDHPQFS